MASDETFEMMTVRNVFQLPEIGLKHIPRLRTSLETRSRNPGLVLWFTNFLPLGMQRIGTSWAPLVSIVALSFSIWAVVCFLANLFQLVTLSVVDGLVRGSSIKGMSQPWTDSSEVDSDSTQDHSLGIVSVVLNSVYAELIAVELSSDHSCFSRWKLFETLLVLSKVLDVREAFWGFYTPQLRLLKKRGAPYYQHDFIRNTRTRRPFE